MEKKQITNSTTVHREELRHHNLTIRNAYLRETACRADDWNLWHGLMCLWKLFSFLSTSMTGRYPPSYCCHLDPDILFAVIHLLVYILFQSLTHGLTSDDELTYGSSGYSDNRWVHQMNRRWRDSLVKTSEWHQSILKHDWSTGVGLQT